MAFTNIPNSDIDPGSPLSTELMTALRDNDEFLFVESRGLILIERLVVATDTTNADFTATLNGDLDETYFILGRARYVQSGSVDLRMRANGAVTTADAIGVAVTTNEVMSFNGVIQADKARLGGNFRSLIATAHAQTSGGSSIDVDATSARFLLSDTPANITSLGFTFQSITDGIGAGSTFTLYRMRLS